jgi:dipeptidyl aminopeptidase/acylaminoacyl peptidase
MTDVERTSLHRDNQQWMFDWMIKETGRVYHFQPDGRGDLPTSVRSHAMISKHLGQAGNRLEKLARSEAAAGHEQTALDIYYRAALSFMAAQHTVFSNNPEKIYLHSALLRCYDEVRARAPYQIEHLDFEFEGQIVSGNLHLAPVDGPAPLIFFIPGCDVTKESWPNPAFNQALQRGMHVFSFDGPGQGESNLRGIALKADSYERAASAVLDRLLERPEIGQVGVYGLSFGSFWALRLAANDDRVQAVAAPWATYCDLNYLMTQESPRFKQLFAYLTQASSEAELDAVTSQMTLLDQVDRINCPTLLVTGEYDPRSPLEHVYEMYDSMKAPTELWVYSDQFHHTSMAGGGRRALWEADIHATTCDWLRDRFDGKPQPDAPAVLYLESGKTGPNSPDAVTKRHWYES